MQIFLDTIPSMSKKNLPHIVALEEKRRLCKNFVPLQMPQRQDTWLELAFRSTWGSQRGPSSTLTETKSRPWAYRHGAPVSPSCRGKQLPADSSLRWHNGCGNPPKGTLTLCELSVMVCSRAFFQCNISILPFSVLCRSSAPLCAPVYNF